MSPLIFKDLLELHRNKWSIARCFVRKKQKFKLMIDGDYARTPRKSEKWSWIRETKCRSTTTTNRSQRNGCRGQITNIFPHTRHAWKHYIDHKFQVSRIQAQVELKGLMRYGGEKIQPTRLDRSAFGHSTSVLEKRQTKNYPLPSSLFALATNTTFKAALEPIMRRNTVASTLFHCFTFFSRKNVNKQRRNQRYLSRSILISSFPIPNTTL